MPSALSADSDPPAEATLAVARRYTLANTRSTSLVALTTTSAHLAPVLRKYPIGRR